MGNEVELKLLIAPQDIERLLQHSLVQASLRHSLPPQHLLSVYYDTPELDLKNERIALRLRRIGDRWIQTVKTEGKVAAGLHERPEWESETAEDTLNFTAIPDEALRQFFSDEKIQRALRPVFVTEFTRTGCLLELSSGEQIELAIDQGTIRAGEQQSPICEVEFELKAGNPARLFELALALHETIPLKLENVSKAERGYRLVTAAERVPTKASIPELSENLSAGEALRRVLQAALFHLQANEEGALRSDDPEFIHQMRVALRRMRSALSVFSPLVPPEQSEPIKIELRWLTKELDAARNWDVFTSQTLASIFAAFPHVSELEQLRTISEEARQHARLRAQAALSSVRYQRILLQLGAWFYTHPWNTRLPDQVEIPADGAVRAYADQALRKWHKRLKKCGKRLASLSPAERHRVRISVKKLRYACEFFSPLYAQKRVRRYLTALTGLQEVLGLLNDAATTEHILLDVVPTEGVAHLHAAQNLVLGWVHGASQARSDMLGWTWKHLLKQKVFW